MRRSRQLVGPALSPVRDERGVTLMELLIAITLVAAISTGLLYAMSTSLATYEKMNHRLEENRRVMGMEQALERQIGGVMPVTGNCGPANAGRIPVFNGDQQSLRFVSSSSLAEGARGYPRLIEYQVLPDPNGGVRLMMNEQLYAGPAVVAPLCSGQGLLPVTMTPASVELAGQLAYCRMVYRAPVLDSPLGGAWLPAWREPNLPRAVRIEMAPLHPNPAQLPFVTVNVPIHVTREVLAPYVDQ